MKKLTKCILIFLAFLAVSCEKEFVDNTSTGIELVPPLGYISFRTNVATKTPIITSLRGESFGVFGFSYSNTTNWGTARAVSSPDVFQNLKVTCDENGVPSYDLNSNNEDGNQLMPWSLLKLYSFFAYYPYDKDYVPNSQGTITDTDRIIYNGISTDTPRITYNLPIDTNPVNPDILYDLMTAHSIDHNPVRDAVVSFNEKYTDGAMVAEFQHRLFCLEVVAQNFNDDNDIIIKEPELVISNLKYKSITVPLQRGDEKFNPTMQPRTTEGDIKFAITGGVDLIDGGISVYAQNSSNYNGQVAVSGSKNVMLIPQENLTGQINFMMKEGETWVSKSQKFSSNIHFEEGKKYTISLNFTGDAIVIVVSEAGSWEPFPVNYEFA